MSLLDIIKKPKEIEKSTQAYLDIAQIKDSLVVMKDGSLRIVLLCSAINFDLKTEGEQDAIIAQYQNFVNSLSFHIQILIQSRRVDLTDYLAKLRERVGQEQDEFFKAQIADYLAFIKELIEKANIMDKKFYIIIPYFPPLIKTPASWEELISGRPPKALSTSEFETFKIEVLKRANVVASSLGAVGLRCIQLNTQELIELYYNSYNPDISPLEHLLPAEELSAEIIKGKNE